MGTSQVNILKPPQPVGILPSTSKGGRDLGEIPTVTDRLKAASGILSACSLCGNRCGADRLAGDVTICEANQLAEVSHVVVHRGEEPPISGTRGCGNVFFQHCSLTCVFCQNWQISSLNEIQGNEYSPEGLAMEFLRLQEAGVHTLGLVGATSHLPTVVPALIKARLQGLNIPVVHNSGGYDTVEALKMLDGLVDIYLPDMKYGSDEMARVYSGITNYVAVNRAAVREMYRQVGDLVVDCEGIGQRGLIVRHLVLPKGLSDTVEVLQWLARDVSKSVAVSIMSQYNPAYQASTDMFPELNQRISKSDYQYYIAVAEELGFETIFTQDIDSAENYNPDFSLDVPFTL